MNMRKQQGRKTWLHLGVFLLSVLATGGVLAGSVEMVAADTIGNVVDNAPDVSANNGGSYVPKLGSVDSNGNAEPNTPWNTYYIPSLQRERTASEGSFVKWGYNGWIKDSADGYEGGDTNDKVTTPSSAYDVIQNMAIGPSDFTQTDKEWSEGTIGTTTNIQFLDSYADHGDAFFSINYVDKDNLMDVSDYQTAADFAQGGTALTTNRDKMFIQQENGQDTVHSKVSGPNYRLADGQSFRNGYLQVTGNVPIRAQLAQSETTVDGMLAGNWGVMVRAKVAKGIDVRSFAASIDWSKSYYNLNIDTAKVNIPLVTNKPIRGLTFPLQFDHHVYLDPHDPQAFFLKVKGIPFNFNTAKSGDLSCAQMLLPKSSADYADYLHNRIVQTASDSDNGQQSATTLDRLTTDPSQTDYNSSADQTSLDDDELSHDGIPNFPESTASKLSNNSVWDPIAGLVNEVAPKDPGGYFLQLLTGLFVASPVYSLGNIGRTVTLLNSPIYPSTRATVTEPDGWLKALWIALNIPSQLIQPLISSITSEYMQKPFYGNAHINFSFDMSKYQGSKQPLISALSEGKLFASPYADGGFNKGDGKGDDGSKVSTDSTNANRSPIQISMYDSSQLVDPYGTTWHDSRGQFKIQTGDKQGTALDRTTSKDQYGNIVYPNSHLLTQLQAGTSPMDYAVIKEDQVNNGRKYPTYTNFTSWTGAIVPYDRDYWDENSTHKSKTDTLHSDGKIGDDLNYRTATPDPGSDGILVNAGINNQSVVKSYTDPGIPSATQAGTIDPMRYANVYSLYDYSKSTPSPVAEPTEVYDTTDNPVKVSVNNADGENITGTNVNKSLKNATWKYTGTMGPDNLALADASLGLDQSLNPTLDLTPEVLLADRKALESGTQVIKPTGTYRDSLAKYTKDGFRTDLSGTLSQQGILPTTAKQPFQVTPDTHGLDMDLESKAGGRQHPSQIHQDDTFDLASDDTASLKYQAPVTGAASDYFFDHIVKFARLADVHTVTGYTVPKYDPSKVASSAQTDDWLEPQTYDQGNESYVQDNNFLLLSQNGLNDSYLLKKSFSETGNPTTHILTGEQETVGVTTTATKNPKKDGTKSFVVRIPKIPGTTVSDFNVTTAGASVGDQVDTGGWMGDNFVSYPVTFTTVPETITWTYKYQIASAADSAKVPLLTEYMDLLLDSDNNMFGESNGIDFNVYRNPSLTHVPTLDFGEHSLPKTKTDTGQTSYGLNTKNSDALKDAQFTVVDNSTTIAGQSSWRLLMAMSPFVNGASSHNDWQIDWGEPSTSTSVGDKEQQPSDYQDPTQYTPTPAQPLPKDEWWQYYNHQAQDLNSDWSSKQLYYLNRLHEKDVDARKGLTRYYPSAQLILPAGSDNPIGGQYKATIRYTLGSRSDGI
ncbi:hypothetical protein FD09_GL002169 [Schleiferilactobacillus perolens DSM 12744]|uniref:Uncharacterized protein n=2 Tax=Schleiferilactobacillus perolens TaxID=100468 RepID=A0A0R1MYX7_9LACO|nr:hypothetical protein FD09_GL002169 [Schleiferilactobacillus perolens DSM 12744]